MGGGFPPLWFILINLKMAYIRTLKLLHFFKHHSCEQILQKKNCLIKGRVENGQTAGWCLKNQKWLIKFYAIGLRKKLEVFLWAGLKVGLKVQHSPISALSAKSWGGGGKYKSP